MNGIEYTSLLKVAETAVAIQDASNYKGITIALCRANAFFMDHSEGRETGEELRLHITQLFIYKLMQLTFKREPMEYGDDFTIAYRVVKMYIKDQTGFGTPEEFKEMFPKIEIVNWPHMAETMEFAKKRGIVGKLTHRLRYLNGYAGNGLSKVRLGKDTTFGFTPSFSFMMFDAEGSQWFNGGLIYHASGSSGVSAPEFSVRIGADLKEDWEVHT